MHRHSAAVVIRKSSFDHKKHEQKQNRDVSSQIYWTWARRLPTKLPIGRFSFWAQAPGRLVGWHSKVDLLWTLTMLSFKDLGSAVHSHNPKDPKGPKVGHPQMSAASLILTRCSYQLDHHQGVIWANKKPTGIIIFKSRWYDWYTFSETHCDFYGATGSPGMFSFFLHHRRKSQTHKVGPCSPVMILTAKTIGAFV